ncbi:MAG: hypothetical protein ACREXV_01760 [Polaromonas sp.]
MNKIERPGEGELLHSSAVSTATWQRPRRPRILVVEDTADIRHFLTALLEDQYEVMAGPRQARPACSWPGRTGAPKSSCWMS